MQHVWPTLLGIALGLLSAWVILVVFLLAARPKGSLLSESMRLLPDTLRLLKRLATDPTLPRGVRVRLWLLFAYLAMPFDLIPDFLPVIGYADDAIIVCLVLRSVVRRAGAEAVQRHWRGSRALGDMDLMTQVHLEALIEAPRARPAPDGFGGHVRARGSRRGKRPRGSTRRSSDAHPRALDAGTSFVRASCLTSRPTSAALRAILVDGAARLDVAIDAAYAMVAGVDAAEGERGREGAAVAGPDRIFESVLEAVMAVQDQSAA
jgi:uncharacterized membrane protein YkvA (DUF1232 family)